MRNCLWRPDQTEQERQRVNRSEREKQAEHERKEKAKRPKLPPPDDLCKQTNCPHLGECKSPCSWITIVDGTVPRREPYAAPDCEQHNTRSYKDELYDLMQTNDDSQIETIRAIADDRTKAIAAMLHAWMSVKQIGVIMELSPRQVYRVINVTLKTGEKLG